MKVVILRGMPGSGKSTWAKNNLPGAFVCSADHYFEKDGEYKFNPSQLGNAHGECMRIFICVLSEGRPLVVVDNTNVTKIEIAPYLSVAQAFGYDVEIICIDPKLSLKELSERNVHGVPYQSLKNMERRWEWDFPPHWPREQYIH